MANLTVARPYVSVPEFGEWGKRNGKFTRDYSRHFATIRSVTRYRKRLLSWSSSGNHNNDELVDQSSTTVKHPELYPDSSESDNSHYSNNRKRQSPAKGGCLRFLLCCIGR